MEALHAPCEISLNRSSPHPDFTCCRGALIRETGAPYIVSGEWIGGNPSPPEPDLQLPTEVTRTSIVLLSASERQSGWVTS